MIESQILHIAQDEKFINAAYYLYEQAFPDANRFVIIKPSADPPVRFLNKKVQTNAQFEVKSANTVQKLVDLSKKYQVTVFHGLNELKGAVYLESDHKDRFVTNIFGAEIYNRKLTGEKLLGPKTQNLTNVTEEKTAIDYLKDIYRSVAYRNCRPGIEHVDIKEVLYKMGVYASLPSSSHQKYIDNNVYNPSVKKVPFSYYPLEYIMENEDLMADGKNILLGNSASATNNHLEAFDLLENFDLRERKIYAPLSYGQDRYAKAIASQGKKVFPENFIPLTEFLPIEEYNKIISRCGIVIMNHYRPQAMGNIIASLFMGAKVFLNDTGAYEYFNKMGCHVFLIEEELKPDKNPFQLLSEKQIKENRQILHDELSTDQLVTKMRTAFKEIFNFAIQEGK